MSALPWAPYRTELQKTCWSRTQTAMALALLILPINISTLGFRELGKHFCLSRVHKISSELRHFSCWILENWFLDLSKEHSLYHLFIDMLGD